MKIYTEQKKKIVVEESPKKKKKRKKSKDKKKDDEDSEMKDNENSNSHNHNHNNSKDNKYDNSNSNSSQSNKNGKTRSISRRTNMAPPNKMLFLQNLPKDVTKEEMERLFISCHGFIGVNLIENKPGIGFADFDDTYNSSNAQRLLNGYNIRGQDIIVEFAQ